MDHRQVTLCGGLLLISVGAAVASLPWDGLRVTFGKDANAFAELPRTEAEAKQQGFIQISDCFGSAHFRGKQYVKNNDYAVVLLFDIWGTIAGIQSGIPNNLINGYPFPELQPPFVLIGNRYFVTAYFIAPVSICNPGRSEIGPEGTARALFLQDGPEPITQSTQIAMDHSHLNKSLWVPGRCYPAMGVHYWRGVSENMNCRKFYPIFLMYDSSVLIGFGFAFGAKLESSRYEKVPQQYLEHTLKGFFQIVPRCLLRQDALTTMHIYFTSTPKKIVC